MLSFVGAKGGSGTSTLCVQIARELSRTRSVALVDADLSGRRSIAVLLDAVRTFDGLRLEDAPPIALIGGFKVAELVEALASSFSLRAQTVQSIFENLAHTDTLIVDAPQPFAGALQPLVAQSAKFIVVMEPTLLGTTGARAVIADHLRTMTKENTVIILQHRDQRKAEVSLSEAETLLDRTILAEIPFSTHRDYSKAIASLCTKLSQIAPSDVHLDLTVSETPIGERRTDERRDEMRALAVLEESLIPSSPAGISSGTSWEDLKRQVHTALASEVDAATIARSDASKIAEIRERIHTFVMRILEEHPGALSLELTNPLCEEVMDEALGLGPLEGLLRDAEISEIMVNGPNHIFVERRGKLELTNKKFLDEGQLRLIIERIIAPLGRRIDESSPMVDARLPDGSRVNAIIPPLSLDGATLTIRRFGTKKLEAADLIRLGAVTSGVMDFLRAAVQAKLNIIVSGGTGSGKTTFLNILSCNIPSSDRIVTIEDAAELELQQTHVVRLESRPPNIEGRGEIKIRDLVRNSLRMRPDRIVVGECRGGEALDMLQAMNTGHDGSLTTVHANSPRDALSRIETMVMMAGFDLPVRAIREQVSSAVDLIIQTARMRDGSRKVISVAEVVGMEGDLITMQEIVTYKMLGFSDNVVRGQFEYSGVQPACLKRFEEYGISFDVQQFGTLAAAGGLW
ncbi:MAG TPA: ATPase, T2SS/T4P/T4SS family [Candidatus Baltobacteraceae bacterium]|nr:ATPase, T2SS/T4P/T4SS family [Candidatus Baltobacteraceae bacterium]